NVDFSRVSTSECLHQPAGGHLPVGTQQQPMMPWDHVAGSGWQGGPVHEHNGGGIGSAFFEDFGAGGGDLSQHILENQGFWTNQHAFLPPPHFFDHRNYQHTMLVPPVPPV
ncbi:unnamed protein product, partial [Amoebophrya sp. A25]